MRDPVSAPSDQMVSEVCRTGDCFHPDWPDTYPTKLTQDRLRSLVSASLVVAASEMPDRPCSRGAFLRRATEVVTDSIRRELWPTDDEREFRRHMAVTSFGCPNSPRCGAMLADHTCDGRDSDGNAINPRCPEATT